MKIQSRFVRLPGAVVTLFILTGLTLPTAGLAQTDALPAKWTIEGVALPEGVERFVITDINNSARVVGSLNAAGGVAQPILIADLEIKTLGVEGTPGAAYAISDEGVVVGAAAGADGFSTVAVQFKTAEVIELSGNLAADVNQSGTIAGTTSEGMAVTWIDGQMTTLPLPPGSPGAYANSINTDGWVVGQAVTSDGLFAAVLWQDGEVVVLEPPAGDQSIAYHINGNGLVTGVAAAGGAGFDSPFTWQDGTATALPMSDYTVCGARQSNLAGIVVGSCSVYEPEYALIAMLWHEGTMIDLNSLLPTDSGWMLEEAQAINDQGQITGHGTLNGVHHAFVMSPVS